jgi:CheY-like chemotaxis protein
MKVLLVDDDIFLRDMYALKFRAEGHEVDTAANAPEALSCFERGSHYDVVLLDMVMPGMSGVEFISVVRETYPDSKSLHIVLSNQGLAADIDEAKRVGANGYLIKADLIPSEVVERVESIYQEQK